MSSPYRAGPPSYVRAPPASPARRAVAFLLGGLAARIEARRTPRLLVTLARSCPSDFARLLHGDPGDPSGTGPRVVMAPAVSAAQANRALRGCSAEERDAVAQHVGGLPSLQASGRAPDATHRARHSAPPPSRLLLHPTPHGGGSGGHRPPGCRPSHAPGARRPDRERLPVTARERAFPCQAPVKMAVFDPVYARRFRGGLHGPTPCPSTLRPGVWPIQFRVSGAGAACLQRPRPGSRARARVRAT